MNEIKTLFPGFRYKLKPIGVIPPLARVLAGFSSTLTHLLSLIPFVRSHLCGAIVKPDEGD